jgi:ATP-binding cassette subfamily B protein
VVLGYGCDLYFQGAITLGTLFAFLLYVQNFFDPVQQLSQLYSTFLSATAALDKIMDVLDEEPEVSDRPGAHDLPELEGRVRFEGVRFGYGKGVEVLHGIDLDVHAGTTVALVGHTAQVDEIAKLLARFYDPREGRMPSTDRPAQVTVLARRQPRRVCRRRASVRARCAAIAFGPPARRPAIAAAAQAVGANDFIMRLEHGLRDGG